MNNNYLYKMNIETIDFSGKRDLFKGLTWAYFSPKYSGS